MQIVVPVTHISGFEFNFDSIKNMDHGIEVEHQVKVTLVKIFEREISFRSKINRLKEAIREKTSNDFSGMFSVVDKYGDGLLDPDK